MPTYLIIYEIAFKNEKKLEATRAFGSTSKFTYIFYAMKKKCQHLKNHIRSFKNAKVKCIAK